MDNSATNKNHIPFQTWVNHGHGWPTTSTQGLGINPHTNSQHLGLNLSSDQQLLYNHPQASGQSCTNNMNTNSHSAAPHMSNLNLPNNAAALGASHLMSFAQQIPPTSSMWVGANRGKTIPSLSLPQPNQGPQPCSSQHFPPLPASNSYKTFPDQAVADQSLNLPSCGMSANMSQATFGGHSREPTGVDESSHSYDSSTSQEHPQWMPSSQSNEAVNESTPAVPVDNEPSQKPVGKKKRSLILNLRTQLINQLENVNKLLESLPQDAGNDGQASNNALQQTEASDTQEEESMSDEPEEPTSPAESEEIQESCSESGDDNDSDFTPQNDDSLSDCPSGDGINSEDDHIDSSPKSPTNETPTTQKIKEEEEDPLSNEKNDSPSKRTPKTKQKKLFKTMVESKQKEGHSYKRNYCLFCSKPVIKMSRHLTNSHSYKAEVAIAFQYPANSKERKNVWTKLTNQGNFAHNKAVLKTGKGQLAVRVRPQKTTKSIEFVPCVHCLGLYKKRTVLLHMKRCPLKDKMEDKPVEKNKRVISRCALLAKGCDNLSEGFKDILGDMVYNEVTEIILDDPVLIQFGEHMFNESGFNVKSHQYLRQNLRHVARLVLEAQKSTPMQSLQDFFDPSNFRHVVSAVKVIAGYDPEKKTYTLPSLAYKLGYNLKKICGIIEQNAIKSGDTEVQESCKTFLSLYENKWKRLVSSHALTGGNLQRWLQYK
ncbi:uncharacterized protein LOC119413008 [Nematolebias whitei]|uniref:uncharacterized protein LOC119413008 n=1 Tax=Nematolebias whitei TaxID=451745 RepID=UPI00189A1E0D|nr:uncharacterized protein LOC119413008 [Nematolebias whitei]